MGQAARGAAQPAGGWVQAGAAAQQAAGAAAGREGRQVTVAPVEIKTGKMHDSHRAQVLLYLLLMEERYGKPLDWGMLWYTTQTGAGRGRPWVLGPAAGPLVAPRHG